MKRDKLGGSYLKFKDLGLIPELLEAVQRAKDLKKQHLSKKARFHWH